MVLALPAQPAISLGKVNISSSSRPAASLTRFRDKLRTYCYQSNVLPSHLARVLSLSLEEYNHKASASTPAEFFTIHQISAIIRYMAVRRAFWTLEEKVELFTLAYPAPFGTHKVEWVISQLATPQEKAQAKEPEPSVPAPIPITPRPKPVPMPNPELEPPPVPLKPAAEIASSALQANPKPELEPTPLQPTVTAQLSPQTKFTQALTLSEYVCSIRGRLGLTRNELASLVGVGPSTLTFLLSPKGATPPRLKMRDPQQMTLLLRVFYERNAITSLTEVAKIAELAYPDPLTRQTFILTLQKEEWYTRLEKAVTANATSATLSAAKSTYSAPAPAPINSPTTTSRTKAKPASASANRITRRTKPARFSHPEQDPPLLPLPPFARYIDELCWQASFSYRRLAREAGMSRSTLYVLLAENGTGDIPVNRVRDSSLVKAVIRTLARYDAITKVDEVEKIIRLAYPDMPGGRVLFNREEQAEKWYRELITATGAAACDTSGTLAEYNISRPIAQPAPLALPPLPALSLTRFHGRMAEMALVKKVLSSSNSRLVSILGMGGMGKTRLALELATELKNNNTYPDGVGFISLEGVTSLAELTEKLLQLVAPDVTAIDHVIDELEEARLVASYFNGREILVILDNLEQLVGWAFARFLTELLALVPGLQIIATSRERLNVNGEKTVRLAPLQVPPVEVDAAHLSQEALLTYPAVAMLVEHVQMQDASFTLTKDNVASIVVLCRKLSGLPLALEQAALRLAYFSPQVILETLVASPVTTEVNFSSSGFGSAWGKPARHSCLTANLAWSLDTLNEAERKLYQELLTFEGVFTIEDIAHLSGKSLHALYNSFGNILDKNLVQMIGVGRGQYYILDVIRLTASSSNLLEASEATRKSLTLVKLEAA